MKDDLKRLAVGGFVLAVLVLGLLYWSRSDPKPRTLISRSDESIPPVSPAASSPAAIKERQVESAHRVPAPPAMAIQRAVSTSAPPMTRSETPRRKPVEFPSDLPSAFTAAGFHDALQRVVAECKFPFEVTEEDCTEFPCIAWGNWDGQRISVDECPAWESTFGYKVMMQSNNGLTGISVLPQSMKFGGRVLQHVQDRMSAMAKAEGGPIPNNDDPSDPSDESTGSSEPSQPEKRAPRQPLAKAD